MAIQRAHQPVNFIVQNVPFALLINDQTGHSTLKYFCRHFTPLISFEVPLQQIQSYLKLIDPTVTPGDAKYATFEPNEVAPQNANTLRLEDIRPVPYHALYLRHALFRSIKGQKALLS